MNNQQAKIFRSLILTTALFFGVSTVTFSQDTGMVVNRLAGGTGGRITVTEKGDAASIIRMASSTRRNTSVNGYRVRIFFDNKQNARSQAESARARFQQLFPGIPVNLTYDIPDFKVTAGYCLTNEEAIILWGRIRNQFPKAFLIPEEIPLDMFARFSDGLDEIIDEEETSEAN